VTAQRVDRDAGQLLAGEAERLDLAALVGATGRADAVRLLRRAALRAGREARRLDRVRGAALVATRLGCLPLRDGHGRPVYRSSAEVVPERLEGGPARVAVLLLVGVRLVVQVLAAFGAEAGAVGPAEDLVREGERDGVARPGGDVELVVVEIRGRQLLVVGRGGLVLADRNRHLEHRVAQAAVAGAVQARREGEREDGPGRGAGDDELRRDPLRNR